MKQKKEYERRQADKLLIKTISWIFKLFIKIIDWIFISALLSIIFSPIIALIFKNLIDTTNFDSFKFMLNVGFVFFLICIFTEIFKGNKITIIFKVIKGFLYIDVGLFWLVLLLIDLMIGTHTLININDGFASILIFTLLFIFLIYKGYKNVDSYSNIFKTIMSKIKR